MTGRVLVVDDKIENRKLLEAHLTHEYYDVVLASDGYEAIEKAKSENIDLVFLDVMMPGMDGYEVCRILKNNPETMTIPIVMVTALTDAESRVRGLSEGADEFLAKPIDEMELIARARSLTRMKMQNDQLISRAKTTLNLASFHDEIDQHYKDTKCNILVIEESEVSNATYASALSSIANVLFENDPYKAEKMARDENCECVILALNLSHCDALRIGSMLKSNEVTRQIPIVMVSDEQNKQRTLRGLDIGLNDYIQRPVDKNELLVRIKTLLRNKRVYDSLRKTVTESVSLALTDPLTGLHNRRYLEAHMQTIFEDSKRTLIPLSVMGVDIDFFKSINDTYGHDAGDEVLVAVAKAMKRFLRDMDFICRYGGEEFIIVMPDTHIKNTTKVAERMRQNIQDLKISISEGKELSVTVSIGVSTTHFENDTIEALLKRADQALYHAKENGRNRVEMQ